MKHICPNNLTLWQFVTKPQQTNEHMREVINHSTQIHLLNIIKVCLKKREKSPKERNVIDIERMTLFASNVVKRDTLVNIVTFKER